MGHDTLKVLVHGHGDNGPVEHPHTDGAGHGRHLVELRLVDLGKERLGLGWLPQQLGLDYGLLLGRRAARDHLEPQLSDLAGQRSLECMRHADIAIGLSADLVEPRQDRQSIAPLSIGDGRLPLDLNGSTLDGRARSQIDDGAGKAGRLGMHTGKRARDAQKGETEGGEDKTDAQCTHRSG